MIDERYTVEFGTDFRVFEFDSEDFKVYDLKDNTWHKFIKGTDYEVFLVNRKK